MENSISLSEWISLAEQKDLILTPEHYERLSKDTPYDVVEVDFIRFLFLECPETYNSTKVYEPQELYKNIKKTITLTGKIETVISPVLKCSDTGLFAMMESNTDYEYCEYENNKKIFTNVFYKTSDCKWLAVGNGDGWSRWMLWDDLIKMPKVYFKNY
jgi:hypothetical protein